MNYTTWLQETFPSLQKASSAETYKLIEQARQESQLFRFINSMLLIVITVFIIEYVKDAFSLDTSYWVLVLIASPFTIFITDFNQKLIMRSHLKKIINRNRI